DPERVRADHARASEWFERSGATADAIRHAMDGGDFDRAARLLEAKWPPMVRSYAAAKWGELVTALPDEVVCARPMLGMGFAWGLMNLGELEATEARLEDVERALGEDDVPGDAGVPAAGGVPAGEVARLRREVAAARIYLAQSFGDFAGTVE